MGSEAAQSEFWTQKPACLFLPLWTAATAFDPPGFPANSEMAVRKTKHAPGLKRSAALDPLQLDNPAPKAYSSSWSLRREPGEETETVGKGPAMCSVL